MAREILENRVESLERHVMTLEQLPERMDRLESQFLLLRAEMRDEFSALRVDMAAGDDETRRTLREEIRSGDEETRRFSRVLHEDAISRFALIGEGLGTLSAKVDENHNSHSRAIEASRAEARALFERVISRLDGLTATRSAPRQRGDSRPKKKKQ